MSSKGQRMVKQLLKMTIPAGKAAPAPPVGPRLGQLGLGIMQFCKEFNQATGEWQDGTPVPTVITAYTDRSFTFTVQQPPVSFFLLRVAGVEKGSGEPGRAMVGEPVGLRAVYEIAKIKQKDPHLQHVSLKSLCKCIIGTAKSMGIRIIDDRGSEERSIGVEHDADKS